MSSDQPGFWESSFIKNQEMWGFEPAPSAIAAGQLFVRHSLKNILVPGVGYGRNAQLFRDSGMKVTGIEISETAIEMARKHYGPEMLIHHGSVTDMPFDSQQYDGIFCHALIHLLNSRERRKLIRDCYEQLAEQGYMVFSVISKDAHTYGTGKPVSKDRFELFGGVKMFFYDEASIRAEFKNAGLIEVTQIKDAYPFFLITCKKQTP